MVECKRLQVKQALFEYLLYATGCAGHSDNSNTNEGGEGGGEEKIKWFVWPKLNDLQEFKGKKICQFSNHDKFVYPLKWS